MLLSLCLSILMSISAVGDETKKSPTPKTEAAQAALKIQLNNELSLAIAERNRADRTYAYYEQVFGEIEQNTKAVASMWWRGWRSASVAERYITLAVKLEEMAYYAKQENLPGVYDSLHASAENLREMSQFVSLGGKETVEDGTGTYTARIADIISKLQARVSKDRRESSALLSERLDKAEQLTFKLNNLISTTPNEPSPK